MSVRSRVTDIRNRFEGVPVKAERERFVSAVDAPAAEVSEEGRIASLRSAEKTEAAAAGAPARRRRVPAIVAGDTDELRALKRQAAAKEKEIQELAARVVTLNERLARITSLLDASASAPVLVNDGAGTRVRSAEYDGASSDAAKKLIDAARGKKKTAGTASNSNANSLQSILAAARSAPKQANGAPNGTRQSNNNSTNAPADNSLEAILAAARGGSKAGGGAKFSKMIRDMK